MKEASHHPPLPLTLAVDSTEAILRLAVADSTRVLAVWWMPPPSSMTGFLVEAVQTLMKTQNWTPSHLGALAVVCGPGSFSGIRIGMSAVFGWADAWGLPVWGSNVLELLGRHPALPTGRTAILLDARRNGVYWSVYESHPKRDRQEIIAPREDSPDEAIRQIQELQVGTVVGDDGPWQNVFETSWISRNWITPPVAVLALQTARCLADNETPSFPEPFYIRPADAKPRTPDPARVINPS